MRWVGPLFVLAGCLSKPSLPQGGGVDCTFGAWQGPRKMTELETAIDDSGPWLSHDRLSIWFTSGSGNGVGTVRRATRTHTTDPFDAAVDVSGMIDVSTGITVKADGQVFLSSDELEIWFDHTASATGIYHASRSSPSGVFLAPTEINISDQASFDMGDATLTDDGLLIVVAKAPGSTADLLQATRPTRTAPFDVPTTISAVATSKEDCCASLNGDGTIMYYASENNDGDMRLMSTTRASITAVFDAPLPVTIQPTDLGADNTDPALSADGLELVYASDAGGGDYDLYETTRTCD